MIKFFSNLFRSKASKDKATLVKLLSNGKYRFRTIGRLQRAIGSVDRAATVQLLGEIGARPEYRDNNLWALTSRVGLTGRRRDRIAG